MPTPSVKNQILGIFEQKNALCTTTEKEILGYYPLYRPSVLAKMPDERFVGLMNGVFVGCFT